MTHIWRWYTVSDYKDGKKKVEPKKVLTEEELEEKKRLEAARVLAEKIRPFGAGDITLLGGQEATAAYVDSVDEEAFFYSLSKSRLCEHQTSRESQVDHDTNEPPASCSRLTAHKRKEKLAPEKMKNKRPKMRQAIDEIDKALPAAAGATGATTATGGGSSTPAPKEPVTSAPMSSSRANRSNRRGNRVDSDLVAMGMAAGNKLFSRRKRLTFARSPIHAWGLFTLEPVEEQEMVIEYVGEIISNRLADYREEQYELCGIGSSYLFRLSHESVIDATKKGNIARFMNHSCDPNCTAKLIDYEGETKIAVYALRPIAVGEEITYDYKFPYEEDKIPCFCKSPKCRVWLN